MALLSAMMLLALDWRAPPECPSEADVVAAVQQWLERDPAAELASLGVHATVTAEEGRYQLVLDSRLGRRQLSAASCPELAQAAAVVLALLLEPALFGAPKPAPPPEPAPPPPPPKPELHAHVRAAALADVGTLPVVSPGWHATLGLEYGPVRVELFGGTFAPQQLTTAGGRRATLSLDFEAGARGCYVLRIGRVQPMGCAGATFGRLTGAGEGVVRPQDNQSLWAAVLLGLGVRLELVWRLALTVALDLGVPLARSRWSFDDLPNPLYTTPVLVGRGALGLEVRFW